MTDSLGRDVLGVYEERTYLISPEELNIKLSERVYEGGQVVVMKQEFTNLDVKIILKYRLRRLFPKN